MKSIYRIARLRLRPRLGLRRSATVRATTTLADQCVASASNFAVGVVVARLSGPAGLGAFALAYTCWILVATLCRSFITDPMTIQGDMRGKEKDQVLRRGFAVEVLLGVGAALIFAAVGAVIFAFGQHTFGVGLLAVAPWIIFLDLQDYWRWIGFMQGMPKKSLQNDLMFAGVQAIAFVGAFLAGQRTVFVAVSAWGLGAAVATLYGLWQFQVRPSIRGGMAFLGSRLPTSRWLAGERAASWAGSQLFLILAAVLLGPAAFGGLKAAQALVLGPAYVVINAGGSIGLPEASRQLAEHGWAGMARVARLVTGAGVLATSACTVVIFVAGGTLLEHLYGSSFASYAVTAQLFAVSYVIAVFCIGPTLTLTATVRMRPLFIVQLGRVAVSVAAVTLLSAVYGANGAAMASILAASFATAASLILQSSARRSVEKTQNGPSPAWVTSSDLSTLAQGEAR